MTNQGDATAKRSENALLAATIVKPRSAIECGESSLYIKYYTIVHKLIFILFIQLQVSKHIGSKKTN